MGLALLVSGPSLAQDDALIEAQKRINDEAAEAVGEGNHERAVLLLRSSIELQELNIIWLNLGRVYQKMGRCAESRDAYQNALRAPAAEDLPEGMVSERVTKWLAELVASCPGTLHINCHDERVKVTVNDRARVCGESVTLPPGEYKVVGRLKGAQQIHTARVEAIEITQVLLAPRPKALVEAGASADEEAVAEMEAQGTAVETDQQWVAWTLGGAGVAAILAGTLVYTGSSDDYEALKEIAASPGGDRARYEALKSDVETADAAAVTIWLGGSALLVASGMLFFWEW